MLHAAMPALRNASSKLESLSRCLPTPFVRKIFFATNAMDGAGLRCLRVQKWKKFFALEINKNARECQAF